MFGSDEEVRLVRPMQEIAASEVLEGLPRRIHEVIDRHVKENSDRLALIEDGGGLTIPISIARCGRSQRRLVRWAFAPATA